MKKIAVLSDTHKNLKAIASIEGILKECDLVFHLGDFFSDTANFNLGGKLIAVNGNCDFLSSGEAERVFDIENVKVLMCHGHKYGVKSGYDQLEQRAAAADVSLCLFGHTHQSTVFKKGKTLFVNPGCMALTAPEKSYAYVLINNNTVTAKIVQLNKFFC